MRDIYKILIASTIAVLFAACGGGSGDFSGATGTKVQIADCNVTTTELLSGDVIVKDVEGTVIVTSQDSNGTNTVCVDVVSFPTGKAHIVR